MPFHIDLNMVMSTFFVNKLCWSTFNYFRIVRELTFSKMGKKGYNWKARQQPSGEVDYDEVKELNKSLSTGENENDEFLGNNKIVFILLSLFYIHGKLYLNIILNYPLS